MLNSGLYRGAAMQLDRSQKPQTNGEIKFEIPSVKTFNLENGLKIFFCEKNDLPIIRINLLVNSGSRFDPVKYKAFIWPALCLIIDDTT